MLGLVVSHCSGFQRQPLWEVEKNHLEGDAPAAHASCPGVSALPHVELVLGEPATFEPHNFYLLFTKILPA